MSSTATSYHFFVNQAKEIFLQKTKDYGTAWRVLRDIAIVDQIYIKIKRICTLQEVGQARVHDSIEQEWLGVINYAIIGLIQRKMRREAVEELELPVVEKLYDEQVACSFNLMENKNHDYGEAWREMHPKSIADICMMKVHRMRQILENKEKLLASEGIDANYMDIINYGIFAMINTVKH